MSYLDLPKRRLSRKTSIANQIYTFLREMIITALIQPGAVLSENELSEHFNVSRQPIREAFNSLRHEGLISIMPQRGTIVKKISVHKLKQVVFVRTALECSSIDNIGKLPADKYAAIIKKLKKNIQDQQTIVDPESVAASFLSLDDKFHELICAFSDCELTWKEVQSVKGQLDRIRYLSMGAESPIDHLIGEHQEILGRIEACEYGEAKEILDRHLHEVMSTYGSIQEHYAEWFEDKEDDIIGIDLSQL